MAHPLLEGITKGDWLFLNERHMHLEMEQFVEDMLDDLAEHGIFPDDHIVARKVETMYRVLRPYCIQ